MKGNLIMENNSHDCDWLDEISEGIPEMTEEQREEELKAYQEMREEWKRLSSTE